MPPATGTAPPVRPVPAARGVIGTDAVESMNVEQSNTSLVLGERLVLKPDEVEVFYVVACSLGHASSPEAVNAALIRAATEGRSDAGAGAAKLPVELGGRPGGDRRVAGESVDLE